MAHDLAPTPITLVLQHNALASQAVSCSHKRDGQVWGLKELGYISREAFGVECIARQCRPRTGKHLVGSGFPRPVKKYEDATAKIHDHFGRQTVSHKELGY